MPTCGKQRLDLAKRAGQPRGWEQVECVQYRQPVTKTYKTFLATWRPAGGLIRVVIVRETGIQAILRLQLVKPALPGQPGLQEFKYLRRGTRNSVDIVSKPFSTLLIGAT